MNIFAIKDVKKLFVTITIILLGCIAIGQAAVAIIANDYKKEIIAHDYAVAGYLLRNDLGKSQITTAFTGDKTAEDLTVGQAVLGASGYDESINNTLLPEVNSFHQRYAVLALVLSVVFALTIIAVLLIFFVPQDKKLIKANTDLLNFMNGDQNVRLDDNEEGSLSQLFSSINVMATSLTTHIAKEKQHKEFLRDTISDISHQLKTPLAALQMYNEIIQDENTGNEVVGSFTQKSSNELNRMENLIQNLLKLARLDVGTIEIEKRNHNLKDFLASTIGRFLTRAETERKSISLDCDNGIILNCDEEWLLEAVSNIIKNALDHTNPGDAINIGCDETPVVTRITIEDNGLGIHPEDIHSIFKRFYRSRFSKDKQGIGIGLTLSKSIVEKHGGSIMVESELSKGTTFHLVFPKLTNL
ncbi:MAG: sensor histidine kinase [Firmicutes bacterium HGW-Firmicutes-15]|nr:MAG: sensor histidine kinase [Firmicutes bacterium HGW-Firmicutes-15]